MWSKVNWLYLSQHTWLWWLLSDMSKSCDMCYKHSLLFQNNCLESLAHACFSVDFMLSFNSNLHHAGNAAKVSLAFFIPLDQILSVKKHNLLLTKELSLSLHLHLQESNNHIWNCQKLSHYEIYWQFHWNSLDFLDYELQCLVWRSSNTFHQFCQCQFHSLSNS